MSREKSSWVGLVISLLVWACSAQAQTPFVTGTPVSIAKFEFSRDTRFYIEPPSYTPMAQTIALGTALELVSIDVANPTRTRNGVPVVSNERVVLSGRTLRVRYPLPGVDEGVYRVAELSDYHPLDLKIAVPTQSQGFTNLSCRTHLSGAGDVAILGLIVNGPAKKEVLIRAVGPGLSPFGLTNYLRVPELTIYDQAGQIVARGEKNGTSASVTAAAKVVGAFPLAEPSNDLGVMVTLAPGAYTAIARSMTGEAGDVLVESYLVRDLEN